MSIFSEKEKKQILKDIIEINTENTNEKEVCVYLQKLFKKYDIDSEIIDIDKKENRANLVAEIGEGSPIIGISGHMDVVEIGNREEWSYDPFKLTEKDGKLYGRGTSDMKGGLAALVIAMIELKEDDRLNNGTIRLLATTAEEKEMTGAKLFEEKGYVKDLDGLIIGEPTQPCVGYANKGSMGINVTYKGKTAHSSMPNFGNNAISGLLKFANNLEQRYQNIKSKNNKHSLDASPMMREILGDDISEEKKRETDKLASGLIIEKTIVRGGEQFNSVPEKASLEYNIRTVPEYNNQYVEKLFEDVIKETDKENLSYEITTNHSPVFTSDNNQLIKAFIDTNEKIIPSGIAGATDSSELLRNSDKNIDLAIIGPGEMQSAHQIDEYIEKEIYLEFIDLYQKAIISYLDNKN